MMSLVICVLQQNITIPSAVKGSIAVTVRARNCSVTAQLTNVLKAGLYSFLLGSVMADDAVAEHRGTHTTFHARCTLHIDVSARIIRNV